MIATTTSPSMRRPRWPLVILLHGVMMMTPRMMSAISPKPNQSSLRTLIIGSRLYARRCGPRLRPRTRRWPARSRPVLRMHHRLQLVDVDLLDVLDARRPGALLQADDAARDLDDALRQQDRPGERDDGLEGIDRGAVGGDVRALPDRPGFGGVKVAGIGQRDHAGQEEHDVEHEVDRRLGARPEKSVEHVAAHMAVLRQRIRARHHEQRPVHHDHGVHGPGVRRVERVTREHFPGDHQRQPDDHPGERLADPGAHVVDEKQELLHGAPECGGWSLSER